VAPSPHLDEHAVRRLVQHRRVRPLRAVRCDRPGATPKGVDRPLVVPAVGQRAAGWSPNVFEAVQWAASLPGLCPGDGGVAALGLLPGLRGIVGLIEPPEKTLVADLVSSERKGLACGWYNGAIGIATLPSSLTFGALDQVLGRWRRAAGERLWRCLPWWYCWWGEGRTAVACAGPTHRPGTGPPEPFRRGPLGYRTPDLHGLRSASSLPRRRALCLAQGLLSNFLGTERHWPKEQPSPSSQGMRLASARRLLLRLQALITPGDAMDPTGGRRSLCGLGLVLQEGPKDSGGSGPVCQRQRACFSPPGGPGLGTTPDQDGHPTGCPGPDADACAWQRA
jgi:hypothetical protein